jgi:hypothetical protein
MRDSRSVCFHCGHNSVVWDCDYNVEDYGCDQSGVVHACHCTHCGADIVYTVLDDKDDVDCLPLEENKNECSKLG